MMLQIVYWPAFAGELIREQQNLEVLARSSKLE
jgi:hypothetical protein